MTPVRKQKRRPSPLAEIIGAGLQPALTKLGFVQRTSHQFILDDARLERFVEITSSADSFAIETGAFVRPLQTLFDDLNHDGLFPNGFRTDRFAFKRQAHVVRGLDRERIDAVLHRYAALPLSKRPPWPPPELTGRFMVEAAWSLYPEDGTRPEMGAYLAERWLNEDQPWLHRCEDLAFVADEMVKAGRGGFERSLIFAGVYCLAGNPEQAGLQLQDSLRVADVTYPDRLAAARGSIGARRASRISPEAIAASTFAFGQQVSTMTRRLADRFGISLN